MLQKDTYFISRGVCDFHVTGTASQDGALESVTFVGSSTKEKFDNLLAHRARVRLAVNVEGGSDKRYFEPCYVNYSSGVTKFGGIYEANDHTDKVQIITYNGTNFTA